MGHNATGENRGRMSKIWIYAILLFQLALIGSLVRGLQLSYKSRDRVELLKETKEKLESENEQLKAQARYVQSDYYVEKVAREELQRAKPGETVVILPETETNTVETKAPNRRIEKLANWQKWWSLLVK